MLPKNIERFLDAVDIKDSRDYIYEDVYMKEYGNGKKIGQIWDRKIMKIYDQFDQPETYKACGGYSSGIIYNGYNVYEYASKGFTFDQENPKNKWLQLQASRGYPNRGSSLQEITKFYMKRNRFEGFMRAISDAGRKNALDNGFLILTGTDDCSRSKAGAKKEFVYSANGGGHLFPIVGYNSKGRLVPNSFGRDWGDDGYFTIPYEYTKYLFSTYVIVDYDDTGVLNNLNYQREIKESISLGITDGTNPQQPATREQVGVMCLRTLKKALQK